MMLAVFASRPLSVSAGPPSRSPRQLLRQPRPSNRTQIVFSLRRGDLWSVPREGGRRGSGSPSAAGIEIDPIFSPDGTTLSPSPESMTATFDVFVMPRPPAGEPQRLTYHSRPRPRGRVGRLTERVFSSARRGVRRNDGDRFYYRPE